MSDINYKKISMDGLWNNNPATVQILGLCPLLAVTGSVVNAMGLGLATLVVLMGSNACVSLIRHYVTDAVRLPAFVMIIAAMVTVIEMLMQAYTFELYEILGIFIPDRDQLRSARPCRRLRQQERSPSFHGGRLHDGHGVPGDSADSRRHARTGWPGHSVHQHAAAVRAHGGQLGTHSHRQLRRFLLAILPPGAFLGLGLIIAGKNVIDKRLKEAQKRKASDEPKVSRRVRTTGKVS